MSVYLETRTVDETTILEDGRIETRTAIKTFRDDKLLCREYEFVTSVPSQVVTTLPIDTQKIAVAVWTPEIIDAYVAKQPIAEKPIITK